VPRPPVYNAATLDEFAAELGEGGDLIRQDLIRTFLDYGAKQMDALRSSGPSEPKVLAFSAHALKSSSASLGLLALAATATEIETAMRTMAADVDVVEEASRLVAEYHLAAEALSEVLADGTPDGHGADDPGDAEA
jgi:HPt (histidine-containing phosphotransfer) domain-containing protein